MTAYTAPSVTTDDMDGVNIDRFFTFDDPLGLWMVDQAYASKTVVRDGPALSVSWTNGGDVVDGLDTPFGRDDFVRSVVAEGWGVSTFGQSWVASTTGIFSTDGTYGLAVPSTQNVMYYVTTPDITGNDFDIMMRVQATQLATTSRASAYLIARWQDDNGYLRFRLDFNSSQVPGWGIESRSGGVNTTLASGLIWQGWMHEVDDWYWLRAQGNGATIRVMAWRDGDTPPEVWNGSATDTVWNGSGGRHGAGFLVTGGPIPFNAFKVSKYVAGVSQVLRVNNVTTALNLNDNLPSGITDTDSTGVVEATAKLDAPIGTKADVYWSPFRSDQPWWDFPRDVAQVAVASGAVAPDGYRVNRVFTGQMADIPIDGDDVTIQMISRRRLQLSTVIQPPPVHGFYEGAEATWAVGYALFKCGIYIAPPPVAGTRLYVPFNGSMRAYVPDAAQAPIPAYHIGVTRVVSIGTSVIERPTFIDGPFPGSAAPSVQLDAGTTRYVSAQSSNVKYAPGEDFFSQTANRGRIECYVKATNTDRTNSNDPTATNFVAIVMQNNAGSHTCQLTVDITRKVSFAVNDGVTFVSYGLDTYLPNDNRWHLIGATWDIGAGNVRVTVDNKTENFNGISAAVGNLPTIEDITQKLIIVSYLPIAEMRISSGRYAPSNIAPHANNFPYAVGAVVRRSINNFDGIAEPQPLEAYSYINKVAAGELAKTGFDENDVFMYLPLSFWVETPQLTEVETLSNEVNMRRFQPVRPVSNVYNQVLVGFKQGVVEELWTPVYRVSQVITIAPATDTLVTVPLSPNPVELRTLSVSVVDGTALTSSPPSDVNAINYVSANAAIDGSGAYATTTQLIVTIDAWNPGSATVRFHNTSGTTFYTVNNVNQPAFGLAGKVLRVTDATEFADSPGSIAVRGTRVLQADSPILQLRTDALRLARLLIALLDQPRVKFTAEVWGDPRRKPGQVVAVYDRDRTQVNGQYRLVNVMSTMDGESVTQTVSADQHYPLFIWDVTDWDEGVWGP